MLRYRLLHLSLLVLVGLALPTRADSPLRAPVMLQDIRLGTTDQISDVGELFVSADTVYFSYASHNNPYNVLWRSDGTPEGTFPLGDRFPSGYAVKPFLFGSHSFFLAEDESRLSLWKTDGTRAGTVVVHGGSSPRSYSEGFSPVVMGGAFYFAAALDETGVELWKSDGTPTGTVRVKDLLPGPGSSNPQQLTVMGNELFFLTDTPTGSIRWKSDGTPEGTVVLEELESGSTEGTAARTLQVRDALPGCNSEWSPELNGQRFYLSRGYYRDSTYVELRQVDFSGQGDRLVYTFSELFGSSAPDCSNFAVLGGELFFYLGSPGWGVLWATDGTTEGTREVYEVSGHYGATYFASPLQVARGKLFFKVGGRYLPTQLWTSDGTTEGTQRLRREAAPLGSQLEPMAQVGSTFLFAEWDAYGMEPWRTDGTAAGSVLVKDLQPGPPVTRQPPWFTSGFPPVSARAGSTVYFLAKDDLLQQLWKSDGTEAGTVLVKDIATADMYWGGVSWDWLQAVGSTVYFMANNGHGMELWKSDGTAAGTVPVKDIYPGGASGLPWSKAGHPSPLSKPLAVGGALLFIANDGVHGWELWRSDGTEAGTVLVKDIRPGVEGSNGDWLPESSLGDVLYFFADDGVHGRELWRSDGTEAGTWLVGDLTPGEAGSASLLPPTAANGALYFSMLDATGGLAVWKSNGTAEGTHLLKLLQAGPFDMPSLPSAASFTAVKDQVFFVGFDSAHGHELWKTDGTGAGTLRVTDLNPGPASATPLKSFSLLPLEDHGLLLFAASDGVHGVEPWVTDGTEAGTSLVADLNPGASSSLARGFRRFGDQVFFSADDGVHGQEPWSLALEPLPVTPEEPKTGCGGCQSVGAPGTLALWGVMVLAGWGSRRRRR